MNDLLYDLHTLREEAPPQLGPAVLARVGLGDLLALLESERFGPVLVAFNGRGISATGLGDPAEFERVFAARFGRPLSRTERLPGELGHALRRWDAGDETALRFDLRTLTPFGADVLAATRTIPRGEVRSYGWVAERIGRPRAVRAVGTALGHNPIPILIPCHRVVRSDGGLGQYSLGGPQIKQHFLELEHGC
jgi:methylated-DNA-[protein]-cysteine S-methyltransferase